MKLLFVNLVNGLALVKESVENLKIIFIMVILRVTYVL